MLPVVRGPRTTRIHILAYTIVLLPVSLAPFLLGLAGTLYGISAGLLSLGFLVMAWRVLRDRQDATGRSLTGDTPARSTFRYSLLYLAALFAAIAADHFM